MNENCLKCGGKCCKVIIINFAGHQNEDSVKWYKLHGVRVIEEGNGGKLVIPLPCFKLKDGRCTIYDQRPNCCKNMEVNGDQCEDVKVILSQDMI